VRRRGRAASHTPAPPPKRSRATAQSPCRTLPLRTTSSRAVSPSCPSVVHRHSMGAPTPAAPHSHSGLRFRNRLEGAATHDALALLLVPPTSIGFSPRLATRSASVATDEGPLVPRCNCEGKTIGSRATSSGQLMRCRSMWCRYSATCRTASASSSASPTGGSHVILSEVIERWAGRGEAFNALSQVIEVGGASVGQVQV
jgi:hypothetical protein